MYTENITILKDKNGNLWYYEGQDGELHQVTVVEEDDGHYVCTNITWYLTDDELANCTKIELEVA